MVLFSREKVKGRIASNNEIKPHINDAACVILSRWVDKKTMKLNFGYNFGYENFRRHISRGIVKLAKNLGITNRVMFYSAQKTFARFASVVWCTQFHDTKYRITPVSCVFIWYNGIS